jgi:mannobiose 2-epimerase
VVGTQVRNSRNERVRLHGVNAASLEWSSNGEGRILTTVRTALEEWHVNIIRLPLAQDHWFGKTPEQKDGGKGYRALVQQVVDLCTARGCYVVLDLHWSDAGEWGKHLGQHVMPDQGSLLFWKDCAQAYKNHPAVIFDLYNEPHRVSWDIWRSGGTVTEKNQRTGASKTYEAVGMQTLLDAVRDTGAKNVVLAGGLDWAYDLSGVLAGHALSDPTGHGVIYANHAYPFKGDTVERWVAKMEAATKKVAITVSEFGSDSRGGAGLQGEPWVRRMLQALRDHDWNWIAWDMHPKASPCLVSDWKYTPTPGFGKWVKQALLGPLPTDQPSAPAPSREAFRQQAQRCRQILNTSLVSFYLPACVDTVHGGYFESLRQGKFAPTGEKFLTLQGRQLWFFSTLAQEGIETQAALAAARSGFEFLEGHLRDRRHGGYFSKVSDAGQPVDPRKHVYLNAFALYGLVAYYRASRDPQALTAAQDLFRTLEEKAHDHRHGGYVEFFYEDWQPISDPKEPGYVGAIGTKTYNTHLHVLEALAELYRVWPDALVRQRLAELVFINANTVRHPDFNCNIDGWQPGWRMVQTPANLRASYGHDVECAWLTLDAAQALGQAPALLRGWAEALCSYSLKFGYDREHGGFYYTGPLGQPAEDRKKEWWVQAEALVSMLEMYRLTGKAEYYDVFTQTFDFVEKHQVAREGGWWATRSADGSAKGNQRSSPWQGAYHNGRAMLRCAKLLDELAAGR